MDTTPCPEGEDYEGVCQKCGLDVDECECDIDDEEDDEEKEYESDRWTVDRNGRVIDLWQEQDRGTLYYDP